MATTQLDHIVLLLPYADLQTLPQWLTSHFTVSPGGRHGDGKTENKLVVFQDGTYIELIAFVTDEARQGHWWGDKGYGIIDYAFSVAQGATAYQSIEQRVNSSSLPDSLKAQPLKGGSRTKPDGEKIEWRVAFPPAAARGTAPFWCFDETPRVRRVPEDESLTKHPCGAIGVGSLLVFTRPDSQDQADLKTLLDTIIAQSPEERVDDSTWDLATPRKTMAQVPCQLSLMDANAPYEKAALEKGRKLVCRLALFCADEPDSNPNIFETIEGDEIRIGFCKA